MDKQLILVRSKTYLLSKYVGLMGTWVAIMFFTSRTTVHMVGGAIGTTIIIGIYSIALVKKVILEPNTITIQKLLCRTVFQVNDIIHFKVKRQCVECMHNKGFKYYIPLDGFSDTETNEIKQYIEQVILNNNLKA